MGKGKHTFEPGGTRSCGWGEALGSTGSEHCCPIPRTVALPAACLPVSLRILPALFEGGIIPHRVFKIRLVLKSIFEKASAGMLIKSWFSKYFISYLTIGMLPVVLGFIFYYTNIATVSREVENSNFTALLQACNEMDYMTGEMKNIAYHFWETNPEDNTPGIAGAVLARRLSFYERSLNFPARIMLYYRGDSLVYTSEGVIHYTEFERTIRDDGDLTMSSFFTQINGIRYNTSMKLSFYAAPASRGEPGVVYLYPVPYLDDMPQATLCFFLKHEDIKKAIENYLEEISGNLYLYNDMQNNLFSYETMDLPRDFVRRLSGLKGVGVQEQKVRGAKFIIMRGISENMGLNCISVTGAGDFFIRILPMRIILLVSIFLLALMGVVLAIIMTKRNYKPVLNLLKNIGGSSWKNENPGGNEFDYILDKWNVMDETNAELSHTLNRQRPLIVDSYLRNLLKGEYGTGGETDDYLREANINLFAPWVFVFIIAPADGQREYQTLSRRIRMILHAVDGCVFKKCWFYGIELMPEQQVAVIGNAEDRVIEGTDIRLLAAEYFMNHVQETYGVSIRVGAGRIYEGINKINGSFMEAAVVMADYLIGEKKLMLFEEAVKINEDNYYYPVVEQSMYIQSIKKANRETALRAVDDMIAKIGEAGASPITQCLCFDVINTIIKTAGQLHCRIKVSDIKELSGFTSLEQFRLTARRFTEWICGEFEKSQEEWNNRLNSNIINYTKNHFHEIQFSLQQVADVFDISPNYLSRLFKRETGYTFVDYVSMLRMDKVKELLVKTDKRVKEIVFEVGYMDASSFLRKFKITEGITPGQYRERMRNGHNSHILSETTYPPG
jgi:AraC-like DNA-binding protein